MKRLFGCCAGCLVTALVLGEELPVRYLDYVESSGSQYVDTEFVPTGNTKIEATYQLVHLGLTRNYVFGVYGASNNGRCQFSPAAVTFAGYGNSYSDAIVWEEDLNWHDVVMNKGTFTVDGMQVYTRSSFNGTAKNLYLFAVNANGTAKNFATNRISSVRIYESGVLKRDFEPCEMKDGRIGFWDSVTRKFYGDAAGGSFYRPPNAIWVSCAYSKIFAASGFSPAPGISAAVGEIDCSAPSGEQTTADGKVKYVVTGWNLRIVSADGTVAESRGTGTSCKVVVAENATAELEWEIAPRYLVTAAAGAGGTVSPTEQWVRPYDIAKVVATPEAGKGLWSWMGGRRAERDETFAEVCIEPMDLTAEFEDVTPVSDGVALTGAAATMSAAIAAGTKARGILTLPVGAFELQDSVVLDNKIMVKGAGREKTTLYKKGDSAVDWRLFFMNNEEACVRDLTISNGCINTGTGAGVFIDTNGGTLENCRVQKCWATTWHNDGPSVHVTSDKGLVSRCIIEASSKQQQGKHYGMGASLSKGVIENCLVRNANPGGSNSYGGGLYLDGTAVARNCTVVKNSANYYGGVYCGATAYAINCVVLDNKAPNDNSAGAPNWAGTAANFINCAQTPKANDTCYDGVPDFAETVDYRLLPSSLLRNAGDTERSAVGGLDLDGNPRFVDGKVDIGCYQFDVTKKSIGFAVTPPAAMAGSTFVFKPSISGYGQTATHSWLLVDAAGNETEVPVASEGGFVIETPGVYEVKLSVTDDGETTDYVRSDYLYVAPEKIYVVAKTDNAVAPYDSWEKATSDLNAAVACSQRLPGQEVVVSNGTYKLTASLEFTVKTKMTSVNGAAMTTINGNSNRPIRLDHADAFVSGFTITGGSPGGKGGGVFFDYNGGTLTESIVTGNTSMDHDSQGGGIYMRSDAAHVDRCVIANNKGERPGTANGGGIWMSKGLVENCLVTNNSCNWNGGGIYLEGGKAYNCTVYANAANKKQGGGIYASGNSVVVNCAAYGNTALNDTSACAPDAAGTAICFTFCAFPKSLNDMTAIPDAGFVDAENGDFRLTAASDLRDAGSVLSDLGTKDLDGNDRQSLGSNPDIGCYEYDKSQKALGLSVSPLVGYEGDRFTFIPTIEGYGDGATHFWTIADQNGNTNTVTSAEETDYQVADGGVYDVTLSVIENDVTNEYPLAKAFRVVRRVQTVGTVAGLESAVEDANAADDVVITVEPGTYVLTKAIELTRNTRLVSSDGAEATILKRDGGANFRILKIDHADAFVQGFTLTGGKATDGYPGGGCYLGPNGGTLVDCIVANNKLDWYDNIGAGIGMRNGLVDRCVITNNTLVSQLFYTFGGGVHMTGGTLRNSLITHNYAHKGGGGVLISGGKMIGCTVYGNTAAEISGDDWTGGGIRVEGGEVVNCASYGNTAKYDTTVGAPDVAGEFSLCVNCAFPKAVGTLTAIPDPRFTNAKNGDFTLATGSPLIDKGVVRDNLGDTDLAGAERCSRDSAPDIGCYEYDKGQVGIGFTVTPAEGFADTVFTFTPTVDGAEGEVTKTWELIAADGTVTALPESCETTGTPISDYGRYSVKLTVSVGGKDYPLVRENVIQVAPETMFVNIAGANSTAPYATPATAATNIHDTLAYALDGSTIRVAAGEYALTNKLELLKDIALVSDEGAEKTVLKRTYGTAAPQFGLVRMHSPKALVKGFTITGGYGQWGGVLIDSKGGTLEDSTVVSNRCNTTMYYEDGAAGGCHSRSAKGVWRRCVVKRNATAWTSVGGIQGGIADNCLVAENYTFGENNANGGGMDVASATNCTVACNTSYKRVAGLVANVAYNCLVLGNIQTNSQSVAVVSDWEDDVSVRSKYRYTCTSSRTGEGYVVSDFASAGFVDAANADYHLTKDSPAFKIGSRLSYTADSVDLDGQPRIFLFNRRKARPDAGCYELQHTRLPGFLLMLQ